MNDFMKYLKNKLCVTIALFVFSATSNAQSYKDGISVVQYTADFLKADNMSLKPFKNYNTFTFYLPKDADIFKKETIKFLPSICLYQDGDLILKIESGISMKLPENTETRIKEEIDKLLQDKF